MLELFLVTGQFGFFVFGQRRNYGNAFSEPIEFG
jgi:hypothetical protein